MAVQGVGSTGTLGTTALDTIISDFYLLRDDAGCIRPLMTNITLVEHSGRSYVRNNYGRVVALSLTDLVDMDQQQDLSNAQTTVSPNEVGVQVVLANTAIRRAADPDLFGRTARIMENAYSLKEDQDCASQFTSFTNTIGTSGTVLQPGHIAAANTQLRVGQSLTSPEPVADPIYGVLHPCHVTAIWGRSIPLTDVPTGTTAYSPKAGATGITIGPGTTDSAQERLSAGPWSMVDAEFAGVPIKMDANCKITSSTDANGAIFGKEHLLFVSEWEPYFKNQDDASLRAIEINVVGSYGTGTYRPGVGGFLILADATLPTS